MGNLRKNLWFEIFFSCFVLGFFSMKATFSDVVFSSLEDPLERL